MAVIDCGGGACADGAAGRQGPVSVQRAAARSRFKGG